MDTSRYAIRTAWENFRSRTFGGSRPLIVGLGHFSYPNARSSVGINLVDGVASQLKMNWTKDLKLQCFIAEDEDFILCKPLNFLSNGPSINNCMTKLSIPSENVICLHYDPRQDFGVVRLEKALKPEEDVDIALDVGNHIGTTSFSRITFGLRSDRDFSVQLPLGSAISNFFEDKHLLDTVFTPEELEELEQRRGDVLRKLFAEETNYALRGTYSKLKTRSLI
mmetsp:Transcript_9919/g.27868  ORF Transcript_9919/g.27868 Transcript_9919/m.27868 type:complete len:223 (-) Transcript_9919:70-738(-)|eukprot:CAMPEP_0119119966 /NCGR_PEP_ID=MMETSP1310-20130426/1225_1 /TAXON_ID=464262 /ORGANISM="Genus nov. species nov., Strain RCC2339" /LENGTH=222 /DNA_ID=CAMNT_0007109425 /DNA_START=141 /DNA_END=809 /DNA_ORIENTATION=+